MNDTDGSLKGSHASVIFGVSVRVWGFITLAVVISFISPFVVSSAIPVQPLGPDETSATGSYLPYRTYYKDSRMQSIYLRSDLEGAGLSGPTTITQLCLHASETAGQDIRNFRIRMQNTSLASLSAFTTVGWTTVYGPETYTAPVAGEWKCHDLSPAFNWDGVSNLMIDVYRNDSVYVTGGGNYVISTGAGRSYGGYCDDCAGCGPGEDCDSPTSKAAYAQVLAIQLGFVQDLSNTAPSTPVFDVAPSTGEIQTVYTFSVSATDTTHVPFFDTTGLVAGYKMEERFGTSVTDESSFGNDASMTGSGILWDTGVFQSGGLEFSGDPASYVLAPDSASLGVSDAVSLEAWVYFDGTYSTDYTTIVGSQIEIPSASRGGYLLGAFNSGMNGNDVVFSVSDGSPDLFTFPPLSNITAQTWHHVVGTYDNTAGQGSIRLYIDGVLVDSADVPGYGDVRNVAKGLYIGGDPLGDSAAPEEFRGMIDEVRVYNRALSASEVVQHMAGSYIDDAVRYGFDWNMDGTVDEWTPVSSYVSSGTIRTVSLLWATQGDKTFQVLAKDDQGALSNWRSHTISIIVPVYSFLSSPSISGPESGVKDTLYTFTLNATSTTLSSTASLTDTALEGPEDIVIVGNYAYVTGYYDDGVEVIDISTPKYPKHVYSVSDSPLTALSCSQSIAVSGNYAYVASNCDDGLEILDISDPAHPTHVGAIFDDTTTALDGAYGVFVSGDYAYVTSNVENGLEIIDISNKANPVHAGKLIDTSVTKFAGAKGIYVSGGYAYIAGYGESALEVINVSNPAAPVHVAALVDDATTIMSSPMKVRVLGSYAYVTSFSGLEIVNISNPAAPTHAGGLLYTSANELMDSVGIALSGDYAYIAGITGFAVVNISNPANPFFVAAVDETTSTALWSGAGVAVSGDHAYVLGKFEGLEVINIADPLIPRHEGVLFDDNSMALNGAWDIAVSGNYAYVVSSSWHDGLEVLNISDPSHPVHAGILSENAPANLDGAQSIKIVGDYAYIASYWDDALTIVDISDPTAPFQVGTLVDNTTTLMNTVTSVDVSGDYAYLVSSLEKGLTIVNVSDPANPTYVGSLADKSTQALDGAQDIQVVGNLAYVAAEYDNGLEIINVSNPAAPVHVGKIVDDAVTGLMGASGVFVSGDYAYVASQFSDALEIVNISNPALPTHVGVITDTAETALDKAYDVVVSGNYAFVTSLVDNGLEVIDVSDPAHPTHVAAMFDDETRELNMPRRLRIIGDYIYVPASYDSGLEVIKISDLVGGAATEYVRYGLDWDMDGVVNEWLPSATTYIESGTAQSVSHSWDTDGVKTFQAVTENDGGVRSVWKQRTFEILSGNATPTAIIFSPSSGSYVFGSEVSFSGSGTDDVDVVAAQWRDYGSGVPSDCDGGALLSAAFDDPADTSGFTNAALSLGVHNICFKVQDNEGVWSNDLVTRSVTIQSTTLCSNGVDDDGDMRTDYPADPGCTDGNDTNESDEPQCMNNRDDDGDGLCDSASSVCIGGAVGGDPSCYTDQSVSTGVYLPNNIEGECGDHICKVNETFGTCPIDCADRFKFIGF